MRKKSANDCTLVKRLGIFNVLDADDRDEIAAERRQQRLQAV